MAFKAMLFLVAFLLLLSTKVSSKDDEFNMEALTAKVPVSSPVKAPIMTPPSAQVPVKTPPPTPLPVKVPPPAKAPAKTPPPTPLPVKAPPPAKAPVKTPPPTPSTKPPTVTPRPPIKSKADCIPQCDGRCSLHSRKRVCMRACMTCCDRCRCVPPGTYGNKEVCGSCYANMTTRGNRSKCP